MLLASFALQQLLSRIPLPGLVEADTYNVRSSRPTFRGFLNDFFLFSFLSLSVFLSPVLVKEVYVHIESAFLPWPLPEVLCLQQTISVPLFHLILMSEAVSVALFLSGPLSW